MYRFIFILFLTMLPTAALAAYDGHISVPAGYVLQRLEETDGEIARPRDWNFASREMPGGWMWTITPEDPKGFYETGLRIQLFMAVQSVTGKSRDEFAEKILAMERSKAASIIRDCPAEDLGEFKRQCLEVLETDPQTTGPKTFHVLYSIMWQKDVDIVTLTIFGAPPEKWESLQPTIAIMSLFRIIGKDFGKNLPQK